jgi:hypothetical protein
MVLPLCFSGEKKMKKRKSNNNNNDEYVWQWIQNRKCIPHPGNILPNVVPNETYFTVSLPYTPNQLKNKQGVCHIVALLFTLKSILRQKTNYGNSNISPCKSIIFKKMLKRNQNPSRYHNSITNFKFQYKPKYHLSKILI